MLLALTSMAVAHQPPNSVLGVTVGATADGAFGLGGRGEAWIADEVSVELGMTTDPDFAGFGADLALRWRPDALCFACDRRVLATFGVGIAGSTVPDVKLASPWPWAVGPDVVGTVVYWLSPTYGLALSLRGGGGPRFVGDALDAAEPAGWGFATLGLAF